MVFMHLPNELLAQVVGYTLPEGFESLALTCKHIHELCAPFIAQHNELRWHFQKFKYYKTKQAVKNGTRTLLIPYSVNSAFNLIEHIANEPSIARYIREADFQHDSRIARTYDAFFPAEVVVRLCWRSPVLGKRERSWFVGGGRERRRKVP
jgi:hypothetical protein